MTSDALYKKQNTWLALAKQPDADRSKECYHRKHFFSPKTAT